MATCPRCRFVSPTGIGVCERCGERTVALPAPMSEPIATPPTVADSKPLPARPALTIPFEDWPLATSVNPVPSVDATPAPLTVRDLLSVVAPTHDRIAPGGTTPAHPGLPGHPMNESAIEHSALAATTLPAEKTPQPATTPPPATPKFVVLRGVRIGAEYPIYEGRNTVGRFANCPVDIDLLSQESVEQTWCSRQHAVVTFEKGVVAVEDLNSLNGTWVNGTRVAAGQRRPLQPGDIVQIGTVQMKFVLG